MKKKGIVKPISPFDIYRLPATSSNEVHNAAISLTIIFLCIFIKFIYILFLKFGWWIYDVHLSKEIWYKTEPRYPQPVSANSLILDKVRKNNKYATLF